MRIEYLDKIKKSFWLAYQKDFTLEYKQRLSRYLLAIELYVAIHPHMFFTANNNCRVHFLSFFNLPKISFEEEN